MARQSPWAQEMKRNREEVPEQFTVVRRIPAPQPQQQYSPIQFAGSISSGGGRLTGNGVDGVMQPGKMAGQVHEGEGVFSANAMQNFTPEEFNALNAALEAGKVDKNMLLRSIGMNPVAGFQSGGMVDYQRNNDVGAITKVIPQGQTSSITGSSSAVNTGVPTQTVEPVSRNPVTVAPIQVGATNQPSGTVDTGEVAKSFTRTTPTVEPIQVRPIEEPARQTVTIPEVFRESPEYVKPVTRGEPIQPTTIGTIADRTGTHPELDAQGNQVWMKDNAGAAPSTIIQPTATSAAASTAVRTALSNLVDQMNGMSDTDRRIADYYLSNIDSTNAANLRVLEHQISADRYMSEQAKQNAIAGLQRDMQADRGRVAGELAIASAERAGQATRDVIGYGQQIRNYEDIALPAAKQNMDIIQRTFDEITLPTAKATIDQLKANLGSSNWSEIQSMIDSGASMERVNATLSQKGLNPLSSSEFASMIEAGAIGQRTWNRQLTAANMLLNTPGENNKMAAAAVYSNLFPGVDFDFSELVSMENSDRFSNGLSQMASYVATNAKFEDVLTAMKKDGTLQMMGMDETQAAQLYNSMRVNAIDAQWDEIENSQFYQDLMNSSDPNDKQAAEDWKEFFRQDKLGMLDYDTLHEYNLYDQTTGTLVKTVYAKDDTEAAKAAASKNLRYEDTGKVQFRMSSTIDVDNPTNTTGMTPTPTLEGQGSEKPVGTKYLEGGRAYEVGAGNEIKEMKIDPNAEAWTKTGDDILALGSEGNPYYKDIVSARAKSIIDGTQDSGGKITDQVVYDEIKNQLKPYDLGVFVANKAKNSKGDTVYSMEFSAKPEVGSIIEYGDKIYRVDSKPSWVGSSQTQKSYGDNYNYITVTDLSDGKQYNIIAKRNSSETIMELKGS